MIDPAPFPAPSPAPAAPGPTLFPHLTEADQTQLSEALQELLAHGSILGSEKSQSALYHWSRQNFDLLRQTAALIGLETAILHEDRLVQALPRVPSLQLNLTKDATIIWLALWYVADQCWRDEGQPSARLTVGELNGVLKDTLLPDLNGLPPQGRLREILRQAARYHLIHFHPTEPFEESGIEVLQTIRRVIPFQDLADWTETAARFHRDPDSALETENENETDSDSDSDNSSEDTQS
ncbi:DUF4194 domain-containing protein [Phragmitibacter flavus]|uniref:DUF4194 domain-containing protein n=1 Tax=Phragmitibacter flavus TaxID=2576071 RepID=A0A5R8KD31_9BACT|nr:DUF4194 domain-containing protein [Phragmitibacter flavus]TLD70210.1 DUF4194 domain-containing protein [Phragmitibacter flavus]